MEAKQAGYDGASGRYAAFFLGKIQMDVYRNGARAEAYFLQGIQFAEEAHAHASWLYPSHADGFGAIEREKEPYGASGGVL